MRSVVRDPRALAAALLCLGIAVQFWTGSRYPSLNEKASMGNSTVLEDPLGFEAARPVDSADAFTTRVVDTTINWMATNRRGMTFGLAFAAAFMTLLRRIGRRSFEGHFSNSVLGVVIGAPLGVCVNCAAPIARGLHAAGTRLETTLAAMISSPTLNVVVLAMLFAMLPVYMATLKVATGLVFVLAVIPLLTRFVFRDEALASGQVIEPTGSGFGLPADGALFEPSRGLLDTIRWVAVEFAKNLWFIVKYTVPLMLLAGLLGAIAVTILPWDTLVAALPHDGGWPSFAWMVGIAVFGLFLPVPIAFDVVVCGALFAAGMPGHYVMVLLFSLGIFSIYSFMVVWEAVSLRVAVSLSLALILLSVGLGVAAQSYERWDGLRQRALFASLGDLELPSRAVPDAPATGEDAMLAALAADALPWRPLQAPGLPADVSVERSAFLPKAGEGEQLFAKHYGDEFGLERIDALPLPYKYVAPYYRSSPLAAGDVHGDGWPDLVIGSDQGVFLYANRRGERFERQPIPSPRAADGTPAHAANLALVDMDDDGWLDVFVATVDEGNYVVYNRAGRFTQREIRALPAAEPRASVASALGFGDLDGDGRLDVVLGNYTSGQFEQLSPERSRNQLLRSRGDDYVIEPLPAQPGQTLSTLVSDLDQDGHPELVIGNDWETPDYFYWGSEGGGLRLITRSDRLIPGSTRHTMSVDSADIDNDGDFELYIAQMARRVSGSAKEFFVEVDRVCEEHTDAAWRQRCEERVAHHATLRRARREGSATTCLSIADPSLRADCIAFALMWFTSKEQPDPSGCDAFPLRWRPMSIMCRNAFEPEVGSAEESKRGIRQRRNRNVLLVRGDDGRYEDRTQELGVRLGGWAWTARFADVDNDQFQDLYIANGFTPSTRRESNFLYRNLAGAGFEDATQAAGMASFLPAGAYVYVDFDRDGDLDVVTYTFDGPIWLHRNTSRGNHSIVFELADTRGNHFGIGSRVEVVYGDGGSLRQVREIKASGGYASSDAPRAHFGLGEHERLEEVIVHWSNGGVSTLRADFQAGNRYRIRRGG